jgi:hypothetical protein
MPKEDSTPSRIKPTGLNVVALGLFVSVLIYIGTWLCLFRIEGKAYIIRTEFPTDYAGHAYFHTVKVGPSIRFLKDEVTYEDKPKMIKWRLMVPAFWPLNKLWVLMRYPES